MKLILRTTLALVLASSGVSLADDKKENDGQDPTRPLNRFDIRTLYSSELAAPGEPDQLVALGRFDIPIVMDNKWVFYYRTDIPYVVNDVTSPDNPDGDTESGMGDWFNQLIWIAPPGDYPLGMKTIAPGFQIKFDTASQQQFGAGQHRFVPLLAWRWQPTEKLSIIPVFKYEKGFGDRASSDNRDSEEFQFKPIINYTLPNKWFLSLWDSTDWVYQLNDGPNDEEWNIPIDIMLGKRSRSCLGLSEMCVYSVQYIDEVVDDFEKLDWAVQLRIGWFFH